MFGPTLDEHVRTAARFWGLECQVLLLRLHASMDNHLRLGHTG